MSDQNLLIGAEQLEGQLSAADIRLMDCRFDLMQPEAGRTAYLAGHIPGAVYADLDRDLAAPIMPGTGRHPLPHPVTLAATFGRLGISARTHVVVYDENSGALAARAWWLLRWLGHENVSLLDGGIARWRSLALPLEGGNVSVEAQAFDGSPQTHRVLETSEIAARVNDGSELRLVDARDGARFRGEVEPIDKVAGHIPGALNLPFPNSLTDDGTWKSSDELQQVWENLLGDDLECPWSAMCGSGVTACHLVISGLLAGLPEPRLYVGSWSEWIADNHRPIATGSDEKA